MKIIDTSPNMLSAFSGGQFDMKRWKAYADEFIPAAKELFLWDLESVLNAGYSWQEDFLPVLNAVFSRADKRTEAIGSFHSVVRELDARVISRFGRSVEADLILCLGLCSGAGWVTPLNNRDSVLFGIEKIIELDWCDTDAMNGLVLHELGHVYHAQYGLFEPVCESASDRFLRQLFNEGIAMVFEQELTCGAEYFHQDRGGWKERCARNTAYIARSFYADLEGMTPENQRYFGDWVRFDGMPDTGYYLGARFVRFLLAEDSFDSIIQFAGDKIREGFIRFMSSLE